MNLRDKKVGIQRDDIQAYLISVVLASVHLNKTLEMRQVIETMETIETNLIT